MNTLPDVISTVLAHIEGFVERPHTGLGGQPVCPFARRARTRGQVEIIVLPFSLTEDNLVFDAVEQFEASDKQVLLLVHPDARGLSFDELEELRVRVAAVLTGRYEVFTGHPNDPFTRAGIRTRVEPNPTLHFVRSDLLADAERRLGARRRSLVDARRRATV